ncbi:MAG: ATP-binding protein [Magnetococcus sp. DMHC-6]
MDTKNRWQTTLQHFRPGAIPNSPTGSSPLVNTPTCGVLDQKSPKVPHLNIAKTPNKFESIFKTSIKEKKYFFYTITLGVFISITLFFLLQNHFNERIKEEFYWAASERFNAIEHDGTTEINHLFQNIELFFNESNFVDRDKFQNFVSPLTKRLSGIQFIAWVAPVHARYAQETEKYFLGLKSPQKTFPTSSSKSSLQVYYIEPYTGNESTLGLDVAANPLWLKGLQQAGNSGQTHIIKDFFSDRDQLDKTDLLIFYPIYHTDKPQETAIQKAAALKGFVWGKLHVKDLIEGILQNLVPRGIDFLIRAESLPEKQQNIYLHASRLSNFSAKDHLDRFAQAKNNLFFEKKIQLFDQQWRFIAIQSAIFTFEHNWLAWIFLIVGLLMTSLISYYLLFRQKSNRQKDRYFTYQNVINKIYEISFAPLPLEEQLAQALDALLLIPWIFNQSKGAILLADEQHRTLHLTAHVGLNPELLTLCQALAYGQCLCGQTAQQRKVLFAACIDDRHDITFNGMLPHGHYSIPIATGDELLGVLTLYLDEGHLENEEEIGLLMGIANTLAALIKRQRHDDSLLKLNANLEFMISERTNELRNSLVNLKKMQQNLVQSETMAALGGVVAGVAHEINTPLGNAFTATTYLEEEKHKIIQTFQNGQMRKSDLEHFFTTASESIQMILANLSRAAQLVRSFKMVAVDQTSNAWRTLHLKTYLEDILITIRPKIKRTQHVISYECPDELEIYSHPGALSQIIVNLIDNSLLHGFANTNSGHIWITATLETNHLHLTYKDDGQGMNEETAKKIFEPFFTTKRGSGGSGLGMHIVFNLVSQTLGGEIRCVTYPDQGTLFQIQFPIRDPHAKQS